MTYYGIVKFTRQRLYLLIASNITLIALSGLFFFGMLNLTHLAGLVALTVLLYVDIFMCERKSSASLSDSSFQFNRAYLFGTVVINRIYKFEYANANQECITEIDRYEAETFSSDTLDELSQANIIFFRNSAVFLENAG